MAQNKLDKPLKTMQVFTTWEYGLINLANEAGFDKLIFKERIEKGKELYQSIKDGKNVIPDIPEKSLALFLQGLQLLDSLENGKPSGELISLDATASGVQLMSTMMRDPYGMLLTNVLNTQDVRVDLYQVAYNHMLQNNVPLVKGVSRSSFKRPIMTYFYNSIAVPMEIIDDTDTGYEKWEEAMYQILPGATFLKNYIQDNRPTGKPRYQWEEADGFTVDIRLRQKVLIDTEVQGIPFNFYTALYHAKEVDRSLAPNMTHGKDSLAARDIQIRAMHGGQKEHFMSLLSSMEKKTDKSFERLCKLCLDSKYMSGRILLRVNRDNIHYIYQNKELMNMYLHLLDTLPSVPFYILIIHDCFRTLARYGNLVRQLYNNVMADFYRSDMLNFNLKQLGIKPLPLKAYDPHIAEMIENADYAIC